MAKAAEKKAAPKKKPVEVRYTSDVNEVILSRILQVRKENGLTQIEFAESVGSNEPYVKAIEQGRFTPSNAFLIRFADKYNVSLDWVFGRTNQKSFK